MARASVNNAARALEGMIARWHKDNNGSLATGGTSTAITVTLNQSSIAAWYDGLTFAARITTTCGATPTINPTGSGALGAKSLYWAGTGTQLAANDLTTTAVATFMYEATSDKVYVFAAPPAPAAASETVAGTVELATQAEVNTGTDTARAITPAGLTGWTPSVGTVTALTSDKVLLADASASGVLKQALVSDITAIAVAASGLVAIERKTGAAVASYDFVTGIGATYRTYKLIGWLQPATDDVELWLRISDDGGSTFEADAADYAYWMDGRDGGGNIRTANSAGDTKLRFCTSDATLAVGNAASERIQFEITFSAPNSTAFTKLFDIKHSYRASTGAVVVSHGGGESTATAAVNGIQLLFESGNIATGDVTLYGVANA
jgi:hypothetical protein